VRRVNEIVGLWSPVVVAVVVAGGVALGARARHHRDDGRWTLALAVTAIALLPERLNLLDFALSTMHSDPTGTLAVVVGVQVAALALVGVALAVVGMRDFRRLARSTAGAA
jgi:hypothetical protein